jgi:2-C-methyl-D-erythritol 2,4-cyclodiphosphate synthase
MEPFRIGFGYDVHPLKAGRKLILGGVEIPFEKGLDGHSDADVVLHALCDALLGSLALGDLGTYFPSDQEEYKDKSSSYFLEKVNEMITHAGYTIGNADITVVLQRPKILPYVTAIRKYIAGILKVPYQEISVKATTTEHLGMMGREEGAAAYAVVLVHKRSD